MSNKIYTLNDNIGYIELVGSHGSDLDIVNTARLSYGGHSETFEHRDRELLRKLLKDGHTSTLEHNILRFRVKCPIFVARQWMRHRIASYNERSGRYTKSGEEFYTPDYLDEPTQELYRQHYSQCLALYDSLLESSVQKQQARLVMPLAMYTEFYFSCNLRALLHFISLRDDNHAQYEIRQYAMAMRELASQMFPETMEVWNSLQSNC